MTRPFKLPVSVLVVVYTAQREVLLLSRLEPAGFWQSVTGSLEPGETPAQAARRELAEETGIRAVPVDRQHFRDFAIRASWRSRYAPGVDTNREHVFTLELAARARVTLAPAEHTDSAWVKRADAMQRVFSPSNRAAIEAFVPEHPGACSG